MPLLTKQAFFIDVLMNTKPKKVKTLPLRLMEFFNF